ncbi:hypothetical protein [uncultured Hyphomicrobium sp.]|uniref:tetratricopeptide repeat protein n=1 Tax=uncultured Hyphomicrobium sp. TaxID=194373 RepID=UPI0025D61CD8|nr:hypothetical protein [uncultured Hyphomicrobium sp.]
MAIISRDWDEADQQAIRHQLERILHSSAFAQSRRRQRFLTYLVGETIAGRGDRIKGYSIALEVFDRPKSFDPAVDPVVRIEAGRLRDKLREYYDVEGRGDLIRIDLPKGSYTPQIDFQHSGAPDPGLDATAAAISPEPEAPRVSPVPLLSRMRPRSLRWGAPALAVALALSAIGAWLLRDMHPAPLSTTEDSPAIAVLPFANLSSDPNQDYFSDGLTEDILTELSRARELRVLARNTTFQYKGKAVDVAQLGRDLNVRYVLEGSVRRSGESLRITAQLIDAKTGAHVWADRFDRSLADVFLVEDEIVSQIFAQIAGSYGAIETAEAKSATRKSPDEIRAYDLVLRAREIMQWDWSTANIREAKQFLEKAVALDPSNARARTELTWLAVIGRAFRYDAAPTDPQMIIEQANKAVLLDPSSARAHMVAAAAYFYAKQIDLFRHETQQALSLAPHDAYIMGILGQMTAFSGDWERGEAMTTRANALNPDAVAGWYHTTVFYHRYLTGNYSQALEILRQDTDRKAPYLLVAYIPLYGQLHMTQEALAAWNRLHVENTVWSAADLESWWRTRNFREEDIAKLMDGVYKSGVLDAQPKRSP